MSGRQQLLALGMVGFVAACAAAPEQRWMKAGVNPKIYEADRVACLGVVDRDFNPYYDYGPTVSGGTASGRLLFREKAAEDMFQDCMRQRGYRLVRIEAPQTR
jgi:hypothetical protein